MKIKSKVILGIFGSILLVLLIVNVYLSMVNTGYELSFSTLFQKLSQIPRIDTSFIKLEFASAITADWGLFNFARDFVNGLWQIIGVLLFVCLQIVNAFVYIFQLIKVLFVGVLG